MPETGVRSGLLLAVLGLWVIMRSTHQDTTGRTLIDHILGKKASAPTKTTAAQVTSALSLTPSVAATPAGTAQTLVVKAGAG